MLELSDYIESKEASVHNSIETNNTSNKINNNNKNSGNVEYVEVNNEIKMVNKRSKSLEKDDKVVSLKSNSKTGDKLKRPDTAPPYLADVLTSSSSSLSTTKCNVSSDLLNKEIRNECYHDDNDSNKNLNLLKTESDVKENNKCDINIVDNQSQRSVTMTWHEHIYRKPPKKPTPYSIMDILQWGCKRKTPSPINIVNSDKNNNSNRSYQNVEPSTLQHLLNLNLNSPRSANNNTNSNHSNSRGLSYAETSEDESNLSDQPLNLCVIKSRDSSPGLEHRNISSIKSKKDMPKKSILKRKRSIDVTSDSYLSNDSLSYKESSANEKDIDDDDIMNEDGYDEQLVDGKRKKKARTTFTGRQIFELEKQFEVKKYLSSNERTEMARILNVTETQVSLLMHCNLF
ncbi:uncharacterized protein DDB_G0287625 [Chironomus tepperi]|uniref:uncharacterized protein DDB_G0287625 n=1 Tax=Chironomus tepperi TaxID=113505 RepID=UPI00391F3E76